MIAAIKTIPRVTLLLLFIQIYATQAQVYIQITDLDARTQGDFSSQVGSWPSPSLNGESLAYLECNGVYLLKGYTATTPYSYFQKTYMNLAGHDILEVAVSFWLIDAWTSTSKINIILMDQMWNSYFNDFVFTADSSSFPQNLCGDPTKNDLGPVRVNVKAAHDADSLMLTFQQDSGDTATFAIRDIKITLTSGTITGSQNFVMTSPPGLVTGSSPPTCPTDTYNKAGVCTFCAPAQYLYPNNTCSPVCGQAFQSVAYSSFFICTLSCSSPNYFYTANSTCLSACPSPWKKVNNIDYWSCEPPCSISSTDRYYSTSTLTCQATCPPPMNVVDCTYFLTCEPPCSSSYYYYSKNDSCIPACPSPLRTTSTSYSACDPPCSTGEYYYIINTTCLPSCNPPFIIGTQDSYNTCLVPNITEDDSKTTQNDDGGDEGVLSSSIINSLTKSTSVVYKTARILLAILSAYNPNAIISGLVSQVLLYLRYINIHRSARLERIFSSDTGSTDITSLLEIELPDRFQSSLSHNSTVPTFARYNVSSSFLLNFWNNFIWQSINAAFLLFILFLQGIVYLIDERSRALRAIRGVKTLFANFLIGLVYDSLGDVALFLSLEVQAQDSSGGLHYFSLALSCFFCVVLVGAFVLHIYVVCRYQKLKKQATISGNNEPLTRFKHNTECIRVIYEDFRDHSFAQQMFFCFLIARNVAYGLIATLLYRHPFTQISLITALNAFALLYLAVTRPLKIWLDFVQQIFLELFVLLANTSFLILGIMDKRDGVAPTSVNRTSEAVILSNMFVMLAILFFLGLNSVLRIFAVVRLVWNKVKRQPDQDLKSVSVKKINRMRLEPANPNEGDQSSIEILNQKQRVRSTNQPIDLLSVNYPSRRQQNSQNFKPQDDPNFVDLSDSHLSSSILAPMATAQDPQNQALRRNKKIIRPGGKQWNEEDSNKANQGQHADIQKRNRKIRR